MQVKLFKILLEVIIMLKDLFIYHFIYQYQSNLLDFKFITISGVFMVLLNIFIFAILFINNLFIQGLKVYLQTNLIFYVHLANYLLLLSNIF